MRIRYLKIRINTDKGLHGTDIEFPNGLVVLRADNSMGKSTCIQSILVALGLESMITKSQRDLPLPPVIKDNLFSDNNISAQVIESDIYLELENILGERIVVHRTVKGVRDKNLITVTYGPALTENSGNYKSEDYFVSRPGAARRDKGFHNYLAKFLGWDIPEVQTYDGREIPLYLQCIFPFFIVEQKRGWANLVPRLPTQFQIREPHKRVIEFILKLDAYAIAAQRIEINDRIKRIESEWTTIIRELQSIGKSVGGVVSKLPIKPITKWPPDIYPVIQIPVEDNWTTLENQLETNQQNLTQLKNQEIPNVNEIASPAEKELAEIQENLKEKEVILSKLLNTLEMERGEIKSVEIRLEKVEQDIKNNKDVKTLQTLGSSIASNIINQVCPTCHQHIEDTLVPLAEDQHIMSIDDNIKFLEEQRRTFRGVLKNTQSVVEARESQIAQLREEFAEERAKIRSLRQTLVSDDRLPSMEAIRKRVELEASINRRESLLEQFQSKLGMLEPLSEQWLEVEIQKRNLPSDDTSPKDKQKIKAWQEKFINQLKEYDFQSLAYTEVGISQYTFVPEHDGFDLPTNISASDFIRIIWSYLYGLLEASRDLDTNHPGLLIFDEPRQQSANKLSFSALLTRTSEAYNFDQQVIFATSENEENLSSILEGIPHEFIKFEGRIIQLI